MHAKLQPLIRENSPFNDKVKTNMPVTWVEPEYICEIKFSEWTSDGKLRHPIFLRLREDKTVKDINTANAEKMEADVSIEDSPEANRKKAANKRKSENTNLEKEILKENVLPKEKFVKSVKAKK